MRRRSPGRSLLHIAVSVVALSTVLAAPAVADSGASIVGSRNFHLTYEGHWGRIGDAVATVNSGSRLLFDFTGRSLHGLFDTSTITVPSQIYVSIDGGPQVLYKVDHDDIDFTPALLAPGRHSAEIDVKDVDEYENRWIPPLQSGVVFTGLRLDAGARLVGRPQPGRPHLEFLGDSITEGVMALCPSTGVNCADGTKDYAYLVARAFHADSDQVGFGKQGLIQPGHGNVGTAAQSFGWNFQGSQEDPCFRPDAYVVNFGTNDGPYSSGQFLPLYLAYLRQIRAADPHAWIFAMRPFGGYHADDIAAAVQQSQDPRIVYVDTTGWLSIAAGDFNGSTHPSAQGHRKAAALLTPIIESTTGWPTI